ncbi:MAG: DUF3987 domain-containing protein [Scytonema sp. CRU_2_7]|nr:DUF3987 domain-containing protein [Scytonema sp. CRU_2_7]
MYASTSTQQSIPCKPFFWFPNTELPISVIAIPGFSTYGDPIAPGHHYIIATGDTPEIEIKKQVWEIQAADAGLIKIYGCQQPISNLVSAGFRFEELLDQIIDYSLDSDKWLSIYRSSDLTPESTHAIAQLAISLLPETEKLLELESLRQRAKIPAKTWEKIIDTITNNETINTSGKTQLSGKSIVNVDNAQLSTGVLTIENLDETQIQAIVNAVNAILQENRVDFIESSKLDHLYRNNRQFVSQKVFNDIVAGCRVRYNEVLPEDELRLKSLMDYNQALINWDEVLPTSLARDLKHDADVLNIDPVMLWQPLLSAVSSLAGGFKLDEYGGIPAVNWTCTVLPSGGGKTRADSLILSPLRQLQMSANADYQEEIKEYKRALTEYEKSEDSQAQEPEKPALRKYLFEVATIQSVLKRLSEQENQGSLWARDEIKGLFSSLNQFSGNETEAIELLLKLWDNKETFIDRVDIENSYSIANPGLGITGGIQNDIFRKVFKDANDGNGMQARFLFAVPKQRQKSTLKATVV